MLKSSDFVALCQVQVALLAQRLGAVWSIVYLTEELVEQGSSEAKLIPVVAHPETLAQWQRANTTGGALLPEELGDPRLLKLPAAPTSVPIPAWESLTDEAKAQYLLPNLQIVMPLMYEGILMGLLVTGREDRPWNESERNEIEKIAQTLAIARSLERQNKWYEQQLMQQQRLQRQQRDLLDNLLHQFRNPLTALRTFGKLLLKRFAPGDANRTVADSIVRESDRLQELLLQFDRAIDLTVEDLAAQKALPPASEEPSKPLPLLLGQTNLQKCLVAEVLEPLVASAKAIAQERNLAIIADIPPNLPLVKADAAALREILSNLIDNALKYTPSGGKVYVQAGKQRDRALGIAISDTGLGIPPADLGKIFERHYRGVQQNSAIPGTGLGLAIVKELVEQMQGEIEVFSPAQHGSGTIFIVWLPIL